MSWWRKLPGVPSIKSAVNWVLGRGQVPDGTRIDPEILDQSSKIEELHSQLEINEAIRAKKRAEIVNKHIESLEVTERQFQVFRNSNIQKLHEDKSIFEGISNEMVNSLSKGTTDWIGFGEKYMSSTIAGIYF